MKKIEVEFRCRRPCGEKCYRHGHCKSEYQLNDQGSEVPANGFYICPHLVIRAVG